MRVFTWVIYKLFGIAHDIFSSFDSNPTLETRGVFLDICKACDRVWHDGLLFKIGPCVICLIKSPLKVMKNAFHFILKALFVLKLFKFLS